MFDKMFGNFEKKTGVNMDQILQLANSLQHANLQDERTLRQVIREVSTIANRPVSKAKEDKIVQAVLNGNMPKDLSSITNMMK